MKTTALMLLYGCFIIGLLAFVFSVHMNEKIELDLSNGLFGLFLIIFFFGLIILKIVEIYL